MPMTSTQAHELIQSSHFADFIAPDVHRCAWITTWLQKHGVPHQVVTIQDKKHIIITYGTTAYNEHFRMKTLIAHYDRADGTPGANDNSAACAQLLHFSEYLLRKDSAHNIKIIFTDGEEAGVHGINRQGAYNLGRGLRQLHKDHDDFFVFDLCGNGDCLILSESGIWGRKKELTKDLEAFHRRCCSYADAVCLGNWYSLPTAYSDNAGFISAGLKAQVITVLPRQEAKTLLQALPRTVLKKEKGEISPEKNAQFEALQQAIINNAKLPPNSPFTSILPKTWQRMHTPEDSIENLSPEAFILVDKFLHYLAKLKEPIIRKSDLF